MSTTSFRRLALSGHQLPPLCGPDKLTMALAEAKPIRQHAPGTLVNKGKMKGWSATPRPHLLLPILKYIFLARQRSSGGFEDAGEKEG
jgi:hypothetical protein